MSAYVYNLDNGHYLTSYTIPALRRETHKASFGCIILLLATFQIKYVYKIQKGEAREPMEANNAYEKDHFLKYMTYL